MKKGKIDILLRVSKERLISELDKFIDGRVVALKDNDFNLSISPLFKKGQLEECSVMKDFIERYKQPKTTVK